MCVALRTFISIPVSMSQGEHSFSKLALVKNCLRSTMGQDRLSALAMLSLERDLARKLNYDSIIDSFASRRARRIRLQDITEIIYSHAVMLGMCVILISFLIIFTLCMHKNKKNKKAQEGPRTPQSTQLEAKFSGGAYSLTVGRHQPT